MTTWIRFKHKAQMGFGTLENDIVSVHQGDMFMDNSPTGNKLELAEVDLLTPCEPSKMLALWNNFHATMEKTGLPKPQHPWYFVKTANTFAAANTIIRRPEICSGKILFEGELGIVIGKTCSNISAQQVDDHVFGYTCINDVTALEYLFNEEKFSHWTRAKCFDGFGVFGPGITTGVEPDNLIVKATLSGDGENQLRQDYPVNDMIYSPREIVSLLSADMTLNPGDIIACGTSVGAGAMKDGWQIRISIDGVGELVNTFSAD